MVTPSKATEDHLLAALPDAELHRWLPLLEPVDLPLSRVLWIETLSGWLPSALAQSASDGALPTLYAATSPNAVKAGYYGPAGFMEFKGPVGVATVAPRARDQAVAAKLWAVSERLTGVHWATGGVTPVMAERGFA